MTPTKSGRGASAAMYLPLAVAPLAFYLLLWRSATSLPVSDDYHAVLGFANDWSQMGSWFARLASIVQYQHNEYKLMFDSAAVGLQMTLLGHVAFGALNAFGNAFVIPIGVLLIFMFRGAFERQGWERVLLLLPVSLLLFQLQYCSTLNWSMASLQNLPVLFFALLAVASLCRRTTGWTVVACVAVTLSIASSGNGFMAAATGLILLAQQRRWRALAGWVSTILCVSAVYFHRYNVYTSQSAPGQSVMRSFARVHPLYMLSFLGASAARYEGTVASISLGLLLCAVFVLAIRRRFYESNPVVFYSMTFLVITAIGVSGLRSDFGIAQSLASRYRMNSNIAVIFAYVILVQMYWGRLHSAKTRATILGGVVFICAAFCAMSDKAGFHFLQSRRLAVETAMQVWEHPEMAGTTSDLSQGNAALAKQLATGFLKPHGDILVESIRLGVYKPPVLPDKNPAHH